MRINTFTCIVYTCDKYETVFFFLIWTIV